MIKSDVLAAYQEIDFRTSRMDYLGNSRVFREVPKKYKFGASFCGKLVSETKIYYDFKKTTRSNMDRVNIRIFQ